MGEWEAGKTRRRQSPWARGCRPPWRCLGTTGGQGRRPHSAYLPGATPPAALLAPRHRSRSELVRGQEKQCKGASGQPHTQLPNANEGGAGKGGLGRKSGRGPRWEGGRGAEGRKEDTEADGRTGAQWRPQQARMPGPRLPCARRAPRPRTPGSGPVPQSRTGSGADARLSCSAAACQRARPS